MIDPGALTCGALFVVDWPYSDNPRKTALRPAVVVSNEVFNGIWTQKKVIAAFLTSRTPSPLNEYHILVAGDTPEYNASGLRSPSYIRLDKLMTVDVGAVRGYIGRLPESFLQENKVGELCKSIF